MITRTDRHEVWKDGARVSFQDVVVDITAEVTRADIVAKARTALATNQTFLGLGSPSNAQVLTQVQRLTRQNNALIRVLGAVLPELVDLLVENSDT